MCTYRSRSCRCFSIRPSIRDRQARSRFLRHSFRLETSHQRTFTHRRTSKSRDRAYLPGRTCLRNYSHPANVRFLSHAEGHLSSRHHMSDHQRESSIHFRCVNHWPIRLRKSLHCRARVYRSHFFHCAPKHLHTCRR